MLKVLGLIASFFFAFAAVPAAYAVHVNGKQPHRVMHITAWYIFIGCLLMYTYLLLSYGFDVILTFNYVVETLSWGTILWYWYHPRLGCSSTGRAPGC